MDTNTHIDILDNFGEHLNNTNQLNDLWKELNGVKKEFEELKLKNENQKNIRDSLEFDINELNLLSPKEDEFNNLKKKLILQNSAKISENINSVINNFQSENPPGIEYLLSQVIKKLDEVKELLDSETQKNIENFNSIYLETIEFSKNIKNLINDDFNNNSLEEIEDKIQLYKKIAKKHNVTENELITLSSILSSKLEESFFSGKELEEKEKTLKNFEEKYLKLSNNLSKLRKNNAAKLDNEINNELPLLKLENASFKTFIEKCDPGHKGIDKVIFKIRTNPKSEMGLIKNISSGGELCRFALAIKVIAEKKPTVMVFDEVDSGIGGAVSSSVGERLKKLGESRQVIVVTHSPQVAAFGNDHFIVEKINSYNEVKISVKKINSEEKINEVARMLSGKKNNR